MGIEAHFVGTGDLGNNVSIELSRIYQGLVDNIFDEENDKLQNYLHIHSYSLTETACFDGKDHFIILAGSIDDPCWKKARKTLHEGRPYLLVTIGVDHIQGIDPNMLQPFQNECLIFPDPSLLDPVKTANLALQIFFIHTPWNVNSRGSLIDYDLADTKRIFAGKVTKLKKMTSDKEHYRQNYSAFLTANKTDLSQAQGILLSLWGQDDVLSIPKANELWEEMKQLAMTNANKMFTFHILPKGEPVFMTTLFLVL